MACSFTSPAKRRVFTSSRLGMDLIEDKVEDLEDLKARVDAKLFRLTLTTSRGERVTPSNAYFDWLAVSLFRQWFVESTKPLPAPILKNTNQRETAGSNNDRVPMPPGRVYRLIGSSSTERICHTTSETFSQITSDLVSSDSLYSRDTLSNALNERWMKSSGLRARSVKPPDRTS